MRYTSSPPHTFRNRIAKSIGVLVAAALVAALGLPATAQAQDLEPLDNDNNLIRGVMYVDGDGFTITWTTPLVRAADEGVNNWIVTVTNPAGTTMVVNERSTAASTLGAVSDMDAGHLADDSTDKTLSLNYKKTDLGPWWFQVTACLKPLEGDADTTPGKCPRNENVDGTAVGYVHGAPAAPKNFAANAVPGGVALTWVAIEDDHGISGYQYAYKMKSDGKPDWKPAADSGAQVITKVDPGEHTFMLRAVGRSDNDTSTTGDIPGVADSKMVTVPMPTPTLPEIAALFLAMLLLGSGAYLLRRRQSGGLTPA